MTLMNNVGRSVLSPPPLSLPPSFSVPSTLVLHAQRKLSTASLFFSRKHPKKLISIQHASPAHCIQSHALTIQSAHLCVCVCVRTKSVCDEVRQTETGRENPFVLPVNEQGPVQALVNGLETGAKYEVEMIFQIRLWGLGFFFFFFSHLG